MRRLWRFKGGLYAPGTGGAVFVTAVFYLLGYKGCFEVPMEMRLTKNAIRNGEVTGYYEAIADRPQAKNPLSLQMF